MSGGGGGAVRAVKSQRRAVAQRCSVPWLGRLVGSLSQLSNFVHRFTNQGSNRGLFGCRQVTGLLQSRQTCMLGLRGRKGGRYAKLAFSRLGHTAALHISAC